MSDQIIEIFKCWPLLPMSAIQYLYHQAGLDQQTMAAPRVPTLPGKH